MSRELNSEQYTGPTLPGAAHHFFDTGSARLHYAEAGSGPTLVLLHGWPQNWYVWHKVVPLLAPRYRLICLDLRGFGWSGAAVKDKQLKESMADDVIALIEQVTNEPVGIIGHDWGGYLGFLTAIKRPDLVSSLLAIGIAHPWPKLTPRRLLKLWRLSYQLPVATPYVGNGLVKQGKLIRAGLQKASPTYSWSDQELAVYADSYANDRAAAASSQLYRSFLLHEFVPMLRGRYRSQRLTVPTTLLHGLSDPVIDLDMLDGYQSYTDQMQIKTLPNVGHYVVDEAPEAVAETAKELFANR